MVSGSGAFSITQRAIRTENGGRIVPGVLIAAACAFVCAFVCILACCMMPQKALGAETQDLQAGTPQLATQSGEIASGTSGTCKWVIDGDGLLTVSPKSGSNGKLGTWIDYDGVPWYSNRTKVKAARFTGHIEVPTCMYMFYGCTGMAYADLSNVDTSSASTLFNMFRDCKSLTYVDLSGLDTSNVNDMTSMFDGCEKLSSMNLSSFDLTKVKLMNYMFYDCKSLKYLDLSNFKPAKATGMIGMFQGCKSLETIYVNNLWTTSSVTGSAHMFGDCVKLRGGNGTYFSSSHTDVEYARIDKSGTPGYFTRRYDGVGVVEDKRLQGEKALDTMNAIIDEGSFKMYDVAVLTTVEGYWDALTAAGIAGLSDACVLMTDGKTLSKQTENQLKQLKPSSIIVCGGELAIEPSVANAAKAAAGGAHVDRCAGEKAPGTAVDIYKMGKTMGGTWSSVGFICTNEGYWDALAAAPISYSMHMPIFLTEGASAISNETIAAMKDGGIKAVYIVGGEMAIEPSVVKQLENAGIIVRGRLWGQSAIETSERVAAYGIEWHALTSDMMGLATSDGYWDALAGAALCGKNGSVIVLTNGPSADSITKFMTENASQIKKFYVFGGELAITPDTENAALKAAK